MDRHRPHGLRDGATARQGGLRHLGMEPHAGEGRAARRHTARKWSTAAPISPRATSCSRWCRPARTSKKCCSGRNGVMSEGKKPKIVVDSTSISLEESAEIREKLAQHGVKFLAAPVSGNAKVIKAGKLTVVASGPQDAFDAVAPYLERDGPGRQLRRRRRAVAHRQDLPQRDARRGDPEPVRDHACSRRRRACSAMRSSTSSTRA